MESKLSIFTKIKLYAVEIVSLISFLAILTVAILWELKHLGLISPTWTAFLGQ